ncbi:hypothetical protein DXG01_006839, partial [Tephrocybe rancida]
MGEPMTRRAHIDAALHADDMKPLAEILDPQEISVDIPVYVNSGQTAAILSKSPRLTDE